MTIMYVCHVYVEKVTFINGRFSERLYVNNVPIYLILLCVVLAAFFISAQTVQDNVFQYNMFVIAAGINCSVCSINT